MATAVASTENRGRWGAPLAAYLGVTFALAWACWAPAALAARRGDTLPAPAALLQVAGSYAPLIAAVVVAARRRGVFGVRALLARYGRWRVGWRWYAVALLGPPVAMLAALGLHLALGGRVPPFPAAGRWPLVAANFAAVLLVGGPLGEEAGWRGFALPTLAERWGARRAGLAVGALWGLWHLPLFLTPGTPQAALPFPLYLAQAVPLGLLFARLYAGSGGSLLLASLFHAAINTWPGPLRVLPSDVGGLRPFALTVALVWLLAAAVLLTGWQGGAPAGGDGPQHDSDHR